MQRPRSKQNPRTKLGKENKLNFNFQEKISVSRFWKKALIVLGLLVVTGGYLTYNLLPEPHVEKSFAAATYVQTATGSAKNSTTASATYTTTPTAGNLLIAVVGVRDPNITINAITGWTFAINESTATYPGQAILYRYSDGTEGTVTATLGTTSGSVGIHIYEYSGVTGVLDQTTSSVGTGKAPSAGTVTTDETDQLLFAAFVDDINTVHNNNSWSDVEGFTERNDFKTTGKGTNCTYSGGDNTVPAIGSYTVSTTIGASANWRGQFFAMTVTDPTYEQSAYRIFNNNNSTDVGTALAAQDTAATLTSAGQVFRLRSLMHIANQNLPLDSQKFFKLQYAARSGTCDTAFVGETYADVTSTTDIAFYNNATPADGDNLTGNVNDPAHSGHTTVDQDYEEANPFTNTVAAINIGQDGMWDFSLYDNGATADTSWCFRMVENSGTVLDTYSVVPEIRTYSPNTAPTGVWNSATQDADGLGTVQLSIEVDDADDNDTKAKIEYETDSDGNCDGPWSAATLIATTATADFNDSGGAPDINNANPYQVGTTATTRIITSSGSNTVDFDWNSDADLPNANGTQCLRLTVNDDTVDQTTPATQTVTVDNVDPSLSTWSLDMSAGTLTLNFDETVDASTFTVTGITLQDAGTATTSYTLTDSTTSSGDGTQIVVDISTTDLAALEGNDGLVTSLSDSYITITTAVIDDQIANPNQAIADGSGLQAAAYTGNAKYRQSAYRFFNNLDSTDVGTALAAQDTAATLSANGDAFRLRGLVHLRVSDLPASAQSFKLQFATKSGTCDTNFTGETYADVTAATAIAYNDNTTPADGATLTGNANDPVHSGHTTVDQTYEELNNFTNSVAAIPSGQDGMWDFALIDNDGTSAASYCLRWVESTGTLLDNYDVIPEINTVQGNNPPTGAWNSATQKTDGTGYADLSIEVDDPDDDDTKAKIEYETDSDGACDGPWADATLVGPASADFNDSGGAPDVNNSNPYQVGTTATTRIITSSGSNTVQFDWDSQTDLPNANGTQCLRLTVNDDTVDQTTPATQTLAVDNTDPTVSAGNISVAGASGTSGAFIIGDTVTVTWDNSAGGDNNTDLSTATADLSDWGGGANITMTDTSACGGTPGDNVYEACYTLVQGTIDTTTAEAAVGATDTTGNYTNTLDGQTYTVDTNPPNLTSWSLDMSAATLTLVFDESVESSVLAVTGITLQDAVTATTSYTLTNSTTSSGDGTTIVIDISTTDLAAIEADDGLATSQSNSYLTITTAVEDDLRGNDNVAITDGSGQQANAYAANPKFRQSAYRLFNNTDSTDVGSALAAQDTAATLASDGDAFRLRGLVHIYSSDLGSSGQSFKLQFATKSGACDTNFSGESYADVTAATAIAYNDNTTPADGATLTGNANDPVHSGHTTVDQTYEELNNFTNSVAAIPAGQDGMWDFALIDNNGTSAVSYCLRWVKSDGSLLNNYDVIAEITTVAGNNPPTGSWNSATQKTDGTGYADLSIEVDDPNDDDTKAKIEYETDSDGNCDGPWADATLVGPASADFNDSGGAPDVNNSNPYQVGTTATTRIITSSGSNTVQFDWDSQTDLPAANGTQCLRLTVNDDTVDQSTPATQTISVDNVDPTVSAGNISVAGASGTSGAFIIGDTVTVTWDNSAGGDNNSDIATATADLSDWGGGSNITMTDTAACGGTPGDNIYEACYTLVTGTIDTTTAEASVGATDTTGNYTNTADGQTYTVDTNPPNLTTWNLDMSAGTLTLVFDESVESSVLDVTGITIQDAATATTSYTLTNSTTSSGDGTSIVIDFSTTDLAAIEADDDLATSITNSYLIINTSVEDDLRGNDNVAIADGSGQQVFTYTANPKYEQSAYRFFNNVDSTDVGTVLAAQDTAATLSNNGDAFRLRALVHVKVSDLAISGQSFKLQYAAKSGSCDTGFTGESYADVTAATSIAYNNNPTPADGDNLTANANDPVHGADNTVDQDYEELNNFTNSVALIPAKDDGMWDFSLIDNDGSTGVSYCLRLVKSDGSLLDTYSVIPEINTITGNSPPTGSWNSASQVTDGSGDVVLSIEVNDSEDDDTRAKLEYETDSDGNCDGPWAAATLLGTTATADFDDSGGAPDINNANPYQVGSGTNTRIITSSGSNTVDFDWDSDTDLPTANGTQCLRLTVNDDTSDQTTPATFTLTVDNTAPTITAGNVTIDSSGCTGTGGTCKIGDTIVFEWDNSASGDNNTDITLTSQVVFDLSSFGLSSTANPDTLSAGVFSYTYNVVAGSIDANNLTFTNTVTDPYGNVTGPVTSSNSANLDNIAPTVTDGNISISGATGSGGEFIIGDTVTVTWDNSAGGDNNTDLSTATADLSDWGGGSSVAMTDTTACGGTAGDNIYEACYTLVTGTIDSTTAATSVEAIDDAGNETATADGQTYTVDTNPPNVTTWNLDMSAGTLTLIFDESVESSVLNVTGITLQDAATATTSYTLTNSTTSSGDGTSIVIDFSTTDLAAIEADDDLATSVTNSYLTINTTVEDDLRGNDNVAIADGSGQQVFTYTADPKFEQSAYRWFNNADSTDVGTALAVQDTAATLASNGDAFRLRSLIHVKKSDLAISGQDFKLQYAAKSGSCDTGFTGESYADVTAATSIAYNNNPTPADGDNLTANANDPVHGADNTVDQDYEELNNFTNTVAIVPVKDDGMWDFSLIDNDGSTGVSYCLRLVKSDGSLLDTYSVIPEINTITGNSPPTGSWNSASQVTDGSGDVVLSIEVNDSEDDDTRAKIEYETDSDGNCDGPWAAATLLGTTATADFDDSGGAPDINNANPYQVGSGTNTRIITSSGSNTVDFDWDSDTDLPTANGTQCLRLTVNDDAVDQTTPAAQTVNVDNVDPSLSSWSLNLDGPTMTLIFDESVDASALDVTAITLQDAATAGTSYTLTNSTTSSPNGTTIVINISTTDYNAIQANTGLATAINDSYLTLTSAAEGDLVGNPNNAIADGSALQAAAYTPRSSFEQSAYRLFNNTDSTDVGAALAAQDTAASLAADGDAFRLRQLIHVGGSNLPSSAQDFKLQYALRSGSCDTGFAGESYNDVTTGTAIAFNDNPTPADSANLTANANDPVHAGHTTNNQTYEELNNFTNSVSGIQPGRDGQWDFSLIDNDGTSGRTYCFRVVKADGSLLDTYSVVPQITTYDTPAPPSGGGSGSIEDWPYNLEVTLADGADCATTPNVSLYLAGDSVSEYLAGNSSNLDLETWQPFTGPSMTIPWTLPAGDGSKTVYVRFRSPKNNTSTIQTDSILLAVESQCGQVPVEPVEPIEPIEPEEPGQPAGPEGSSCTFDCAKAGYRLYIVNPNGTRRYINSDYVKEEDVAPGIITYYFEDKGEDFDYNDVVIKVNRSRCDRILVEPLSVNANWQHQVRMELLYGGLVKKDLLLWQDSHAGLFRQSLINLNKHEAICQAESILEPLQRGFVTVYEHINYQGRSETFYVGENDIDLSDNKILSNVISSIKVFGAVVRFFDRLFFKGASSLFSDDDPDLRDNYLGQDYASSLKVYDGVGDALADIPPPSNLPVNRTPPEPPTIEETEIPEEPESVSLAPACSVDSEFVSFLALESQSQEVRRLQELLQCLGYFPADVASTAIFGPVTEQAVAAFQADNGIDPVGYVGPSTRAALNQYVE